VAVAGLGSKFYEGLGRHWVNDSLAGVFYVVFWCLAARLMLRAPRPLIVVTVVFVVTSALEVLQLWHPPSLVLLRSSFLGRTLLGSSFDWLDFPHYAAGAAIGWIWLRWIDSRLRTRAL
jgi:hypothetical protein